MPLTVLSGSGQILDPDPEGPGIKAATRMSGHIKRPGVSPSRFEVGMSGKGPLWKGGVKNSEK